MAGPCMCGDPYCARCGWLRRCEVCGNYSRDECEGCGDEEPCAGPHCECSEADYAAYEARLVRDLEEEAEFAKQGH